MKKRGGWDQFGDPQVLSFLVLGIKSIVWGRLARQSNPELLLRTQGHPKGTTGDCGFIASQSGRSSSFSTISDIASWHQHLCTLFPYVSSLCSPLVQAQ